MVIIQGETKSHRLFSILINKIVHQIKKCKIHLFVDDLQIYIEFDIASVDNAINCIKWDLKNIGIFCEKFGIRINPAKSIAVVISSNYNSNRLKYNEISKIRIDDTDIKYVHQVCNLGYQMNRFNKKFITLSAQYGSIQNNSEQDRYSQIDI